MHCDDTRSPKQELLSTPSFPAKRHSQQRQITQSDYVGVYVHPTYGNLEVAAAANPQVGYSLACLMSNQALIAYYNDGNATVTNVEYEVFAGMWHAILLLTTNRGDHIPICSGSVTDCCSIHKKLQRTGRFSCRASRTYHTVDCLHQQKLPWKLLRISTVSTDFRQKQRYFVGCCLGFQFVLL